MHGRIACSWRQALPLLALTLIVSGIADTALAQSCYPRDGLLAWLAERHGERPAGAGVARGSIVELLVRPDGASWTLLLIRPDGLACPLAAGEDWQDFQAVARPGGEGAS